jgi:hypothetical protein
MASPTKLLTIQQKVSMSFSAATNCIVLGHNKLHHSTNCVVLGRN